MSDPLPTPPSDTAPASPSPDSAANPKPPTASYRRSPSRTGEDKVSDDDLVASSKAGNLDAFDSIMARHLRRVRTFVALQAPAEHLIDEISHETFVFAYRRLSDFTGGSLAAWLRAIASNLLRQEVQRFARESKGRLKFAEHLLLEQQRTGQHSIGENAQRELVALEHCLERVPDQLRNLLDLKYKETLSTDDMATRVSRTPSWVRTNLFRARQMLRDCVEGKLQSEGAKDRP